MQNKFLENRHEKIKFYNKMYRVEKSRIDQNMSANGKNKTSILG